jgi:tetratricopeptide (TPR) repeat protein
MWCLTGIASAHLSAGRFEDALVWAQRSLESSTSLDWTYMILTAAYALLDREREAKDAALSLLSVRPGFVVSSLYGADHAPRPADVHLVDGLRRAGLTD